MALAGNTRELSLADLILVKVHDPRTLRVRLSGPAGDGILLIRGGRVVHAAYGELPPADAAYLLVTEEGVDFEVESDVQIQGQTLNLGAQELLMEAMKRSDEGVLKRPRSIPIHVGTGPAARREPPRPRAREMRKSPEAEALRRATGHFLFAEPETPSLRSGSRLLILAAVPFVLLAALAAWRQGWFSVQEHRDPATLLDLEGPRDVLPVFVAGEPAAAPEDWSESYLPTVLYKIVIDARGEVLPKAPVERQPGLEAFESAAKEALKGYRFRPAIREGIAVPIEMNWPVDFVRVSKPGSVPVPVDVKFFNPANDRAPELIEGANPKTPIPERRLRPRIACRVLVDEQGKVQDAAVTDSRPDLEIYEKAALDAVRGYRFKPGVREGVVVPTWILQVVEFQ